MPRPEIRDSFVLLKLEMLIDMTEEKAKKIKSSIIIRMFHAGCWNGSTTLMRMGSMMRTTAARACAQGYRC